jgi:GTP pyrophosphokinase
MGDVHIYMPVTIDQDTAFSQAIVHAFHAHHGQYRDYSKQQYIHHVIRVSEHINEHYQHRDDVNELRVIALLHDVLEDTWMTEDKLQAEYDDEIVDAVKALTHDRSLFRSERQEAYQSQLINGPAAAKIVKLADIYDNTFDVMPDEDRYQRYLNDSQGLLEPLEVDDPVFSEQKQALLDELQTRQNT